LIEIRVIDKDKNGDLTNSSYTLEEQKESILYHGVK
jgi:hypothetical protein